MKLGSLTWRLPRPINREVCRIRTGRARGKVCNDSGKLESNMAYQEKSCAVKRNKTVPAPYLAGEQQAAAPSLALFIDGIEGFQRIKAAHSQPGLVFTRTAPSSMLARAQANRNVRCFCWF